MRAAGGGGDGRGARARSRTAGRPHGPPEPAGAAGRGPRGGADPGRQVRRAQGVGSGRSARQGHSRPAPGVSGGARERGWGFSRAFGGKPEATGAGRGRSGRRCGLEAPGPQSRPHASLLHPEQILGWHGPLRQGKACTAGCAVLRFLQWGEPPNLGWSVIMFRGRKGSLGRGRGASVCKSPLPLPADLGNEREGWCPAPAG